MSSKAVNKEISPLLSNNNPPYQTYNDDLTSIEIHKQSQSISQSKPSKSSFSYTANEGNDDNKRKSKKKSKSTRKSRRSSKDNKTKTSKTVNASSSTTAVTKGAISTSKRHRRGTRTLSHHHGHHHHHHSHHPHLNYPHINEYDDDNNNKCAQCWGQIFVYLEAKGFNKKIKFAWSNLLCIAITICLLLIIWRIWNISTDQQLWNSTIFESDSAPLLLLANVIMMMSYSIENFLVLRICLSCGCLCFALWGLTNSPILFDTAMFNTVMFLLNARHAIILLYAHRYIQFEAEWEQIYTKVFRGKLSRVDFKKLVDISFKRNEKKGEIFKQKGDEITSLCCLVKGRISVVREVEFEPVSLIKDNQKLHRVKSFNRIKCQYDIDDDDIMDDVHDEDDNIGSLMDEFEDSDIEYFLRNPHFVNLCHKNQFIEAPQWVANDLHPDGDRFTVSFVAVDDCEYIKWPKENLINLIDSNSDIYHALSGVLGLHTAKALLKSREYTKIQAELSIDHLRNDRNDRDDTKSNSFILNINRKETIDTEEKNDADDENHENDGDIDEEDDQ